MAKLYGRCVMAMHRHQAFDKISMVLRIDLCGEDIWSLHNRN